MQHDSIVAAAKDAAQRIAADETRGESCGESVGRDGYINWPSLNNRIWYGVRDYLVTTYEAEANLWWDSCAAELRRLLTKAKGDQTG